MMNCLKINSVNNNINFKSAKNISRPAKTVKNKMLTFIALGGISLGAKSKEQTKKYNEKEELPFDFKEDLISRIMNLNKKLQEKKDAVGDITSEDISKHLQSRKFEEGRLPDFNETDYGDDFYDDFNNMNFTKIELADFKKEADIIKNRQLKKIAETICKKEHLNHAMLSYIRDIDAGLENITDKKILKYLRAELKRLADIDYDSEDYTKPEIGEGDYFFSLSNIADIVDVYNTITGKYSRYKAADLTYENIYIEKSEPTVYMKNFRQYAPQNYNNFIKALYSEGTKKSPLVTDFENKQKTEALELLSNKKEQLDYIYEKYYVNRITDTQTKKLCKEIDHTYGVRVLLSDKTHNIRKALSIIKKELEAWTIVSGGKANLPRILDLNSCDTAYADSSAYTNMRGNLHYNGAKIYSPKILRHEIMHLNEGSIFAKYSSNPELVKIIRSIIASKKEVVDGREKEVLDYDKCKYREEFLKAGISPEHIEYAYTNKNEFLAVAAEGDLSQYSPEFKEILIKIGMPKYVFNLPLDDVGVETNVNRVKRILKKNPDAKYDKLVELIEEEKARELSPREKLLQAIFGKKFR